MPPKPDYVFDRDDEWDSLVSFITDPRPQATLGVVSGRRRQGKTFLLSALAAAFDGFYFEAVEATESESLRLFGTALAAHTGSPAPYAFGNWTDALNVAFSLGVNEPAPLIIDEFPYLVKANPGLPSMLQREIDQRGPSRHGTGSARVLLCGSAMSVMGRLLTGQAPLRGRAGLELVVRPLSYRDAATFWGVTDPRLAALMHSIVGGTPAYRPFAADDAPEDLRDFDGWVQRTVLSPHTPLFREARYLLIEESDIRDPALYHSVLAAIAEGSATRGGIANFIGRRTADISHPLTVLEDCGLIAREADAFRTGRARYRITEPLITFYQNIMRPAWRRLELGAAAAVWRDAKQRFLSQVVGPHFEALCREYALAEGESLFGSGVADVTAGTVADPVGRTQLEIDVVALGPAWPGEPRQVVSLGEAKWGGVMGRRDLERLRRARDLLAAKGFRAQGTVLACFSAEGFDAELRSEAGRDDVLLIDLADLYGQR